jgi:hypothetical protein
VAGKELDGKFDPIEALALAVLVESDSRSSSKWAAFLAVCPRKNLNAL